VFLYYYVGRLKKADLFCYIGLVVQVYHLSFRPMMDLDEPLAHEFPFKRVHLGCLEHRLEADLLLQSNDGACLLQLGPHFGTLKAINEGLLVDGKRLLAFTRIQLLNLLDTAMLRYLTILCFRSWSTPGHLWRVVKAEIDLLDAAIIVEKYLEVSFLDEGVLLFLLFDLLVNSLLKG